MTELATNARATSARAMDTLGIVDSRSIAAGADIADIMVKAAPVTLVRGAVVCAGRFLIVVEGDNAAVQTAIRAAEATNYALAGSLLFPMCLPK